MKSSSVNSKSSVANGSAANKPGPVRQCVGCRDRRFPAEMRRFVRARADWVMDEPGARRKLPGRGVYLCSDACATKVAKNRRYPGLATAASKYGLISSSMEKHENA